FFQAEDGIRDKLVTGVQTCAFRSQPATPAAPSGGCAAQATLALRAATAACWLASASAARSGGDSQRLSSVPTTASTSSTGTGDRSEERRVGKECRSRRRARPSNKK